ncbi:MAG: hypothetical protein ABI142_03640 [Bryocella sp.]
MDCIVVVFAVLDGVIEDAGIGSEFSYRELSDVTMECAAFEQATSDVIELKALTQFRKCLCGFHERSPEVLEESMWDVGSKRVRSLPLLTGTNLLLMFKGMSLSYPALMSFRTAEVS